MRTFISECLSNVEEINMVIILPHFKLDFKRKYKMQSPVNISERKRWHAFTEEADGLPFHVKIFKHPLAAILEHKNDNKVLNRKITGLLIKSLEVLDNEIYGA